MLLSIANYITEIKQPGDPDSIKEALLDLAANDYDLDQDLQWYRENPDSYTEHLDDYQMSALQCGFDTTGAYLVDAIFKKSRRKASDWQTKLFYELSQSIMDIYPNRYFDNEVNFTYDTHGNPKIVSLIYIIK